MTFISPRSPERDNQNSLRKFPFSDAASCTNGACVIVPGAVIDAQLYVPGRDASPVWLSSIDAAGILHFSDSAGEFAKTAAAATASTAIPVTFTGAGGPIPGGVVVFGKDADVSAIRSFGGQTFKRAQTELSPSAVTYLGVPGVAGFKLDDGNVVFGAVKMKGANGCDVSTFVTDGVSHLRISAVGKAVTTTTTTGFITKIVANSDNTNFTVSESDLSGHVIDICATGVSTLEDDDLNADQDNTCDAVKKSRGTTMSASAVVSPTCGSGVCESVTTSHTITLMAGGSVVDTITLLDGASLGTATLPAASATPDGKRFGGYYETVTANSTTSYVMYFRYDGSGIGKFTKGADVTLYARWMDDESEAEVTFQDYGTLHLNAPSTDLPKYSNPIRISGVESPVPTVSELTDETLEKVGAEGLADIVLHPTVPSGEVHIGIRGLDRAYSS